MATADGKLNFNFVTGHHNYYSPSLRFADAFSQFDLVDVDFLQTTLTATHTSGSGVFRVANNRFPEGRNKFRNATVGLMTIRLHDPDTGAIVPVQVWKVVGEPVLRVIGSFAGDRTFPAGSIVDGVTNIDGWRNNSPNPADWPMTPLIVNGRNTGMPDGTKPGQTMRTLMGIPYAWFPPGDWNFLGKGTGTYRFELDMRDRPDLVVVDVSIDHGAPQGSPVVNFPSAEVQQVYATLLYSDPADPIYDVHLVPPGTWGDDGSPWAGLTHLQIWKLPENASNPKFMCPYWPHIRRRRLADKVRLVDEERTIMVGDWGGMETLADMPPDTPRFGCGPLVPWGWLIRECNVAKNRPWSNVAVSWRPEILDAKLDQIMAELDPDLDYGIADDCEGWNFGFGAYPALSVLGSAQFSPRTCQSLTYLSSGPNAGKVRVFKPNHGISGGTVTQIAAGGDPAYNGAFAITADDADHFLYTPAATPTASPCPDGWSGPPIAVPVSDSKTFAVSGLKWFFDQNSSYLEVTTSAPHGCDQNTVVHLCNVAQANVDGAYRTTVQGSTVVRLYFGQQQLYMPQLPEATTSPMTFSARSGQQMRIVLLGESGATAGQTVASGNGFDGAVAKIHGWREARHIKQVQAKFPTEPGRFFFINEVFAAGTGYGATTLDSCIAELGGVLPPVSPMLCAIATYVDKLGFDQRANYVGDCKPLASAVVSGGVCTATIASYPINPYSGNAGDSTNFGGNTGENVYLYGVRDIPNPGGSNLDPIKVSGRYGPVTVVNASTISFATPGVPDGPLSAIRIAMFVIRGTPKAYEITAFSRSGTSLTCTSKGHGLQVGSQVYFAGWYGPTYTQKCTVTAVTADNFTATVPGATFDPKFINGRAYAFDPACTTLAATARLSRVAEPGWRQWQVDNFNLAKSRGHVPATYETGYQEQPESYLGYVPWLDPLMSVVELDPVNGDLLLASAAAHVELGTEEYNHYTMVPWGHFSLAPHIEDESPASLAYAQAKATFGRARKTYGVATRFTIQAPAPASIGQLSNWGQVIPDGKLPYDVTVTLDDDGQGGSFTPASIVFRKDSRSPQGYRYTAATSGLNTLRATAPSLGPVATTQAVTLDANGNPGNATVVIADDFNRADGEAGPKWLALPAGTAFVGGNGLYVDQTYPPKHVFAVVPPALNWQVEALLLPAPDASTVTWQVNFRADATTARSLVFSIGNGDNYLRFFFRYSPGADQYLGALTLDSAPNKSHALRLFCQHKGVPGRISGKVTDDATGVVLGVFDFAVPLTDGGGNAVPVLDAPGGIGFSGGVGAPSFDNVIISRLDFMNGITLTGPAALSSGSSATYTITPVGGPPAADTVVTLGDGGKGGSWSPSTVTLPANSLSPVTSTYTAANTPGQATLTATTNPSTGTASLAAQVGSVVVHTPKRFLSVVGDAIAAQEIYAALSQRTTDVVGRVPTVSEILTRANVGSGTPLSGRAINAIRNTLADRIAGDEVVKAIETGTNITSLRTTRLVNLYLSR